VRSTQPSSAPSRRLNTDLIPHSLICGSVDKSICPAMNTSLFTCRKRELSEVARSSVSVGSVVVTSRFPISDVRCSSEAVATNSDMVKLAALVLAAEGDGWSVGRRCSNGNV